MGQTIKTLALTVFVYAGMICGASATIVNYDEAADGDLGFFTDTFLLDMAGTNTISGSSFRNIVFDSDSFFLNLASGLRIVDYSVSISNGFQSGGVFTPSFVLQELDTNTFLEAVGFDLTTNLETVFQAGSEPYDFTSYKVQTGGSSQGSPIATWDWQYTIVTSVIPLPAALPLYGTGLAVMGFLGWRRKRQALRD